MLKFQNTSGFAAPGTQAHGLHANAAGYLVIDHADGSVSMVEGGVPTGMSGLQGVNCNTALFLSGAFPISNGVGTFLTRNVAALSPVYFSGLTDVSGIWVSGNVFQYNGTKWLPLQPTPIQVQIDEVIYSNDIATSGIWSFNFTTTYDKITMYGEAKSNGTATSFVIEYNGDTVATNYYQGWHLLTHQAPTFGQTISNAVGVIAPTNTRNTASGIFSSFEMVLAGPRQVPGNRGLAFTFEDWYGDTTTRRHEGGMYWKDIVAAISGIVIKSTLTGADNTLASGSYIRVLGSRTITQWIYP